MRLEKQLISETVENISRAHAGARGLVREGTCDRCGVQEMQAVADTIAEKTPYVQVLKTELLEIARISGADLSSVDHPDQIVFPTLLQYVTAEVRVLRQAYDEALYENAEWRRAES